MILYDIKSLIRYGMILPFVRSIGYGNFFNVFAFTERKPLNACHAVRYYHIACTAIVIC